MKNLQKGFVVPLLLGIIALLVIGGGIYIYHIKKAEAPVADNFTSQPIQTQEKNSPITPMATSPSGKIAVAGMQQYTDHNFGFSFWYPSSWSVTQATVQNQNKYLGGTVSKQLNISNGKNLITIEEFSSPAFSITDSTGVGACPVCSTTRYYFDASQHTWMIEYPSGTNTGPLPGSPASADISNNTMGGLHMFAGSQRFGANTIIPLSARNFLVVTVDGEIATGTSDPKALARTILALDPKVATPWSTALQIQTIQSEENVYKAQN